jgi:hypothetical protein
MHFGFLLMLSRPPLTGVADNPRQPNRYLPKRSARAHGSIQSAVQPNKSQGISTHEPI